MLKRQLYTVYILTLFIPVLIIGTYLLVNNSNMVYEHNKETLISDNIRIRSIVFELTTSITNLCDTISEDKELASLLSSRYDSLDQVEKVEKNFGLLDKHYTRRAEIASIQLFTDHPDLYSYGHISKVDDNNINWYQEQMANPGYYWSSVTKVNNLSVSFTELQLTHAVNIPGSNYDGLIVISISNNYLKNRIDNNQLDVDLIVANNEIFYSTWGNIGKEIKFKDYWEKPFFTYSGTDEYLGDNRLLEVSAIKPIKSEDNIYVFSSDSKALERVKAIQQWIIIIILFSILVPSIVIYRFTKQLTNRVNTLRREMHRVTDGDYNIIESFKGNDELVDLFKDLKVMISSIKERDQKIYEARIKEQEFLGHQKTMEMEILSSKINPHFLYNTLETIRMKALNSDDIEVARAVKLLGKYMRYNLESTGELTSLDAELKFIQLYLDIQNMRFEHKIEAKIILDSNIQVEEVRILPLLIQPLVENAYVHAHSQTLENGKIFIRISQRHESIEVKVEDNGIGISRQKLDKIYNKLNKEKHPNSSIGLYNIHHRLKLFYGEEYGLVIESHIDKGSNIWFRIPRAINHRIREEKPC